MAIIETSSSATGGADVDAGHNLQVTLPNNYNYTGIVRNFSENDSGVSTGTTPYLLSPEVDDDYRLRTSSDMIFDEENITYSSQNFTKHDMFATTFVPAWTVTGFATNPTAVTTASANVLFRTKKTFSIVGTETLSLDLEGSFSAAMVANQIIEFGFGLTAITTPYDVFDGVYFRANSTGMYGVMRNNIATDLVQSPAFKDWLGASWLPVVGRKYQFIVYLTPREVEFWINDTVADSGAWLAAVIPVPAGYGAPTASSALPMFLRQSYAASAPSTAVSFQLSRYNVRRGGANISTTLNILASRAYESIYSPGTLTVGLNQTITAGSVTRPAAVVPANATSTLSSLGGIYVETGTLALATDAILMSYQVPALPVAVGATYIPNRRLRIDGVTVASGVTTAFATGGFSKFFYIAYGSTAVSLAGVTADTVTTKAYRRIFTPIVQHYTATHAPGATNNASMSYFALQTPIYVNPGEFVALCTYHQGTVGTAGVITHALQFDYSWE